MQLLEFVTGRKTKRKLSDVAALRTPLPGVLNEYTPLATVLVPPEALPKFTELSGPVVPPALRPVMEKKSIVAVALEAVPEAATSPA